jgi:hypothetical protein
MDVCTLIVATTMTLQACYSNNVCHPSADGTKQMCSGVHQISCGGVYWPTYECKRPDGTSYTFVDKGGAQGGLTVIQDDVGTTDPR